VADQCLAIPGGGGGSRLNLQCEGYCNGQAMRPVVRTAECESGAIGVHSGRFGYRGLAAIMKISLYLGSSKYWWAYLGIKSNPLLFSQMNDGTDRAIVFDNPRLLPPIDTAQRNQRIKYFFILWDGASDNREIEKIKVLLGAGADLTTLVVGDFSRVSRERCRVQGLYAEGAMNFSVPALHFDLRTRTILLAARLKAIFMPFKNILQSKGKAWQSIDLLIGKSRIVFCGSYGTIPIVLEQFCARHSVDFRLFDRYEFYCNEPNPSFEAFVKYLRSNGLFLTRLYDRSDIDEIFFLSAIHLLGREYFIEKIRSEKLDIFVNGYVSGMQINVYTTPFYSQHTFIDFGSVVGAGNYPRLADLRYFKKRHVEIRLAGELEELLDLARTGLLETRFAQEWKRMAPQLLQSMARFKEG
jgi:hypothetical protein